MLSGIKGTPKKEKAPSRSLIKKLSEKSINNDRSNSLNSTKTENKKKPIISKRILYYNKQYLTQRK